jgi:hypothetical protein
MILPDLLCGQGCQTIPALKSEPQPRFDMPRCALETTEAGSCFQYQNLTQAAPLSMAPMKQRAAGRRNPLEAV